MSWAAITFGALVGNQLVATVVFLALYLRDPESRRSPVGRHFAYWLIASGALDLTWELLLLAKWSWLVVALLAVLAILGALAWQRVWLVWRGHR